ncbi:putative protein 71 [Rhizopogon vesiculosus]|uniref:Uncharacterized protein n=1 Tax=Rhizopogon vesiculosus TaxID=180088 RepID=A0A1J8RFV8_9AGAM|nr:putative protein 71 [Rhizopogon vesiculosus]
MFWEAVPEGKDPIMPGILDAASESAIPNSENKSKVNVAERPGRPAIRIIDVGNMFLDVKTKSVAPRRAKVGARRRERQQISN